jgi:hypothetical protein
MFLIEKLIPVPPLVVCCIANYYYGYTTMCWCFLGPMLGCRTITLLFNIEFHPAKNQKRCKAVDDTRLLAVVVGVQASGVIWNCK